MLRLRRARPEDDGRIHAVHAAAIRVGWRDHYAAEDSKTG